MNIPYADYAYYLDEYKGQTITEDEFDHCAKMASRIIDGMTFQRLHKMDAADVPDVVRDAVCVAVERIAAYEHSRNRSEAAADLVLENAVTSGGVRSETNDGYSVSHFSASEITGAGSAAGSKSTMAEATREIRNELRVLLAGTGLMYMGCHKAMDEGGDYLCCMQIQP